MKSPSGSVPTPPAQRSVSRCYVNFSRMYHNDHGTSSGYASGIIQIARVADVQVPWPVAEWTRMNVL